MQALTAIIIIIITIITIIIAIIITTIIIIITTTIIIIIIIIIITTAMEKVASVNISSYNLKFQANLMAAFLIRHIKANFKAIAYSKRKSSQHKIIFQKRVILTAVSLIRHIMTIIIVVTLPGRRDTTAIVTCELCRAAGVVRCKTKFICFY